MGLRFLLDTSTISLAIATRPNEAVSTMFSQHSTEIAISATVWHEIQYGIQRLPQSKRRKELEDYVTDVIIPSVKILAYDHEAADWHALERARLASIGLPPPFADGQIAAVAVVHELTLVTANVKDFQHFKGLDVINWDGE